MVSLISVFTLLVVLGISSLIMRVASVALTVTGMSRESARFQARSAYLGVGFTTSESEALVNHPVRRRILMQLMFLGNVGAVTVVAALMVSFVRAGELRETLVCTAVLVIGLMVLLLLTRSRWFDRLLSRLIARGLSRWSRGTEDLSRLLHLLGGDFGVSEVPVGEDSSLCGRSLAELRLPDRGVLVLGIHSSDGRFHGAPEPGRELQRGDTLIAYGQASRLAGLAGDSSGSE